MTVARVVEQLRRLSPVDLREEESLRATLERFEGSGDPYDQLLDDHHVTASAFVVSARGVILHRHRRLGIWVQPGGHVDRGEDPEDASVRETLEETGLAARHTAPVQLFHVDVHPGPRGHTHYDLRYVLVAPPIDPAPPEEESQQVHWFDWTAAAERCEPSLAPALLKLGRAMASGNVAN